MLENVFVFYSKGIAFGLVIGFSAFLLSYGLSFCIRLLKGLDK